MKYLLPNKENNKIMRPQNLFLLFNAMQDKYSHINGFKDIVFFKKQFLSIGNNCKEM